MSGLALLIFCPLSALAADAGATLEPGEVLTLPGGDTPSGSTVLSLSGTGRATLPKGDTAPLSVGLTLPVGSVICTDPDSYTTLMLAAVAATHDEVTLLAGTCVTVDATGVRGGRRSSFLSVRRGSVVVRDSGETPGSVSVRVGDAVTVGEQGGFRMTVEEGGAARTEAVTHPVAVIGAHIQLDLGAGSGSRVAAGEAPSPPVQLLMGGALLRPAPGEALRRAEFAWEAVPYALAFRVEIATDPAFTDVLRVAEVSRVDWEPDRLLLPYRGIDEWWWRVTPVDRLGFGGVPSVPARLAIPVGVGP